MADISLNGNDTILLNGTLLTDFADGDVGSLTFPNETAQFKPGKNGNTLIAFSALGQLTECTLRLIRGSNNDSYINSFQRLFFQDPPSFPLLTLQLVKRVGDGQGNVTNDTYLLTGGVPISIPEVKSNVEGETEQGVTIWKFKFAAGTRQIG
jgi:hypothetical protein